MNGRLFTSFMSMLNVLKEITAVRETFLKKYTTKYSGQKYMMHEIYSQMFKNICMFFIYVYGHSCVERKGSKIGDSDCK